jgi:branched-chain amino acid transport system substrate-binding protein
MKKMRFITLVAALSLALAGCPPKNETGTTSGTSADTSGGGGDILIGEYSSLTGLQGTFGNSTHQGIIMAADEVNAAGGINGRKVKILTEDDQSKAEEAATAVSKLISQNGVVAVLGEVASSASLAAAPICQQNKVPMITPSSTNPEVTKKGDYIFRMCFTDDAQGPAMADYTAKTEGIKTAAILTDVKNDYSVFLGKDFDRRFTEDGGKIVAHASYSNGDSDFRAQLTSIKPSNPQILWVPGYYGDVGVIAQQARDLGITAPLVGGDGWVSPKLIEIGGKALEGCYYANHYSQDDPAPMVRNFVDKYKQRFGAKPDAMAALAYDTMHVLAEAMKRAKKLDGPTLRDSIAATKGYAGVTGVITLGPDRNPIGKKIVVEEIKNGQLTVRATFQPQAGAGAATSTH